MQAFQSMAKGDKQAMAKYNEQQVKQLMRLIEVTRTDIAKVRRRAAAAAIAVFPSYKPCHACRNNYQCRPVSYKPASH